MSAYLDHAATTPMRVEAVEAMMPYLTERFGNPSGSHGAARVARQAIDEARDQMAALIGCNPSEIVFTSGGTEADNLAVLGAFARHPGRLLCSAIEHHAVLRAVESVQGVVAPVTAAGIIDLDALADLLNDRTSVVSVMAVNNEVGTVQPLHKVARLLEKLAPQAVFHTDAVQAAPWVDLPRSTQWADLVSLSAHKFGGPQGVGALVVRKGTNIDATSFGGNQERELRSGTQNVAGIVAMATALQKTVDERDEVVARVGALRDRLVDALLTTVSGAHETGNRADKIAGNAHLRFEGIESEALLFLLDEAGLFASAGASCSSGAMEPSHVLTAMGLSDDEANTSVRLSLGRTTTDHEIDVALKVIPDAVQRLRKF